MDIKQEITKIESLFHLITNINQTIVEEGKISHLENKNKEDYLIQNKQNEKLIDK